MVVKPKPNPNQATAGSSWLGYLTVCCPVWLHAGWTTAAALVNVNLALVGCSASNPTPNPNPDPNPNPNPNPN